ncbi:MAG: hypothetical protein GY765_42100 [bacterium]|nr:hypothetical protein [bacterium]
MKKIILVTLYTFVVFNILSAAGTERLQLVKTIGDEREDYTIFGLADATLTGNKDIYLLNAKANYVAHYDWKGNFKRRIGRSGQGPGDFSFPCYLTYYGKSLYINDRGNRRIVGVNVKTGKTTYFKQSQKNSLGRAFSKIDNGDFLGTFRDIREKRGRFGRFDLKFNIIHTFFNRYPVNIGIGEDKISDAKTKDLMIKMVFLSSDTHPIYFYDRNKKEILISFWCPGNPASFYLYNTEGKLLKKFSHTIEEIKYQWPKFFLDAPLELLANPNKYPDRFTPIFDCIAVHESSFIAFLSLEDYVKKERIRCRKFCLIFDRNGKLKEKFPLNNGVRIFKYSNGYFLGTIRDADVEKLYIYKLNIK